VCKICMFYSKTIIEFVLRELTELWDSEAPASSRKSYLD